MEVACGTGRLLLPFLRAGLEVEGVDSSGAMLEICRRKAERESITPFLHRQRMQELELSRRYRTIYVPAGSFQILEHREEAFEALRRFQAHLEPGGELLITLSVPWKEIASDDHWRLRRSGVRPEDGAEVLIHEATRADRVAQVLEQWLRYEVYRGGGLAHAELRTHRLRWYHTFEFIMMLEQVGFGAVRVSGDHSDQPPNSTSVELVYSARQGAPVGSGAGHNHAAPRTPPESP